MHPKILTMLLCLKFENQHHQLYDVNLHLLSKIKHFSSAVCPTISIRVNCASRSADSKAPSTWPWGAQRNSSNAWVSICSSFASLVFGRAQQIFCIDSVEKRCSLLFPLFVNVIIVVYNQWWLLCTDAKRMDTISELHYLVLTGFHKCQRRWKGNIRYFNFFFWKKWLDHPLE